MSFFKSLVKSSYDINWLRSQKGQLKSAFGYYFLFTFLLSVIVVAIVSWKIPGQINMVKDEFIKQAPDFTATFSDGKLDVSGVEQPYIYHAADEQGGQFKIVVDTKTTSTISVNDYIVTSTDAVMLIKSDAIEVYDGGNTQTVKFEKDFPVSKLTKTDVLNFLNKIQGPLLFVGIIFFTLVFYIFIAAMKLFYLAILSLIVLLVAKINKKDWVYRDIIGIGVYAITIPTIIEYVLTGMNYNLPFLYTGITLIIMFAVIFRNYQENSQEKLSAEPKK